MRCDIEGAHLARSRCEECGLALCRMCDAVVHDAPARAAHERRLIGHVAWDASGSPSMLERLEEALCVPVDAPRAVAPTYAVEAPPLPGPVLHERDSGLARLQDRLLPVGADAATRAAILRRFETARRKAAAIAS
jgi:hypothetical protein